MRARASLARGARRAVIALSLLGACAPGPRERPVAAGPALARLRRDVMRLTSSELGGREAGTSGAVATVAFLEARFRELGLRAAFASPACAGTPGCPALYGQRFRSGELDAANVGAVVPGSDPALADEYVVIGAHHDHLGRSTRGALDADRGAILHPGADDNASGSAAVLELARRFRDHPARRSVLLLHFGAEERGLLGSRAFVARPPVPLASLVAMLNLDMVGRLRDDRLLVDGVGSAWQLAPLLERANASTALALRLEAETVPHSDDAPFAERGVPALHVFTGTHRDYHRAGDTAERVNYAGLARVTDFVEAVARAIADAPERPVPRPAPRLPAARADTTGA